MISPFRRHDTLRFATCFRFFSLRFSPLLPLRFSFAHTLLRRYAVFTFSSLHAAIIFRYAAADI